MLSRFDSSRLPGKALRKVRGKSVIEYVLERANNVNGLDGVCVATSNRKIDDPISDFCQENGVRVFRGSGLDVAGRFLKCIEENGWNAAVRINGDSPLHSAELLSQGVAIYSSKYKSVDIVTNTFPRSYPIGMSVEVVSLEALTRAYSQMSKATNFEHVTEYIYTKTIKILVLNVFPRTYMTMGN